MPTRSIPKMIIAAVFTLYFAWCAFDPQGAVFLHIVYTPLHEAGHIIFRIFGEFMGIAGGSLMQIIVPAVFFGYFIYEQKYFSASIVLFWVGQSFCDVYVYANDAQVMQLPLLSGVTGSEGGFHDWNYLLTETGLLHKTELIARMVRFTGTVLIILAAIGSFVFAREGEEIISDINL